MNQLDGFYLPMPPDEKLIVVGQSISSHDPENPFFGYQDGVAILGRHADLARLRILAQAYADDHYAPVVLGLYAPLPGGETFYPVGSLPGESSPPAVFIPGPPKLPWIGPSPGRPRKPKDA